jgi:hypothetical protein
MERPVTELIAEGTAIERKHFKDVNELLKVTTRRMLIGGYNVPIANLPYTLVSDAAHQLAKGEPFAGCYWDTPKGPGVRTAVERRSRGRVGDRQAIRRRRSSQRQRVHGELRCGSRVRGNVARCSSFSLFTQRYRSWARSRPN